MIEPRQPTKKERYFFKKEQREKERQRYFRKRKLKKILWLVIGALIIGGGLFALILFLANQPAALESEIIARNGIHWHPEVKISILGETQEIPANIGLGIVKRPIHTHDDMGVIHLEFPGLVRKNDVRLGRFFEIWDKKFDKDCVFDKCSGSEGKLKILVNGQENFEFENYIMRDGDKIEIIFE